MRALTWLLRAGVFLLLLGFALSNVEPVTLQFFGIPEFAWRAPLVLILLAVFCSGALLGVLATMPMVLRRNRELARLRAQAGSAAQSSPDLPGAAP
jgi:putative membrane protein